MFVDTWVGWRGCIRARESGDLIISMFRSTIHILLLHDPVLLIILLKGSVLTALCAMLEGPKLGIFSDLLAKCVIILKRP